MEVNFYYTRSKEFPYRSSFIQAINSNENIVETVSVEQTIISILNGDIDANHIFCNAFSNFCRELLLEDAKKCFSLLVNYNFFRMAYAKFPFSLNHQVYGIFRPEENLINLRNLKNIADISMIFFLHKHLRTFTDEKDIVRVILENSYECFSHPLQKALTAYYYFTRYKYPELIKICRLDNIDGPTTYMEDDLFLDRKTGKIGNITFLEFCVRYKKELTPILKQEFKLYYKIDTYNAMLETIRGV